MNNIRQLKRTVCQIFLLTLASLLFCNFKIVGQDLFPYKYTDPACDDVGASIQEIAMLASKNSDRIFVISWIGKNEKYDLDNSRLKEAFFRFNTVLGFDGKRIVTATGGKSDSQKGRLEFYVGSKFVMEITTRIGQDVCWTTPDIDPKELEKLRKRKKN